MRISLQACEDTPEPQGETWPSVGLSFGIVDRTWPHKVARMAGNTAKPVLTSACSCWYYWWVCEAGLGQPVLQVWANTPTVTLILLVAPVKAGGGRPLTCWVKPWPPTVARSLPS